MEIVILDTEYTSWEGSNLRGWCGPNEHREIVQIAAIIVSVKTLKEMDYFSILTLPRINPSLSGYFTTLTGISNEILNDGKPFLEGLKEYKGFVGNRPVYACGDEGDIIVENLNLNNNNCFLELTKVKNLRPWFCMNGLDADKISSGELHKHLGIKLDGFTHNALHDVRSILASIEYLVIKNGASNPFMEWIALEIEIHIIVIIGLKIIMYSVVQNLFKAKEYDKWGFKLGFNSTFRNLQCAVYK